MAEYTGPIQHKRGTSSQWASSAIPLREGELGYDTTVKRSKMGDGATLWAALPWQTPDQELLTRLDELADAVEGAVTPTDAVMAAAVATPGTATEGALNAKIVAARTPSTITYVNGLPATETVPLGSEGNLVKTYAYSAGRPVTCAWNMPTGPDYLETFHYNAAGLPTGSTFTEV